MRVAVTGATGFIGQHVLNELLDKEIEILVIGRTAPRSHPLIKFIEVDLLQEKEHAWISECQPSHLLHLAWYAEHGKFWTSPLNLDWCDATCRLTHEFTDQGGERIVIAGSCAEYDWSYGYCHEQKTPSNPSSLYGVTKDATRRIVEKICADKGVPLAWGRIFLPFGIGENVNRLIPAAMQAFLGERPPFSIHINHWRDILPAETVASGFTFLLRNKVSGIFNISSGQPIQLQLLIQEIATILDRDPGILLSIGHSRTEQDYFLIGSNSALQQEGWHYDYGLQEALTNYAYYFKKELT